MKLSSLYSPSILARVATVGLSSIAVTSAQSSILFFLVAYSLTNLSAFISIIAISNKINSDQISDFAGLGKRSPLMALALTLGMVSLIGMPPAAGFMAKFFIFSTAVQHGLLWLVVVAVLNSVISAYYYLRVVKVMWMDPPPSAEKIDASSALRVALVLSCLGVLVLFFIPGTVMDLATLAKMLGL